MFLIFDLNKSCVNIYLNLRFYTIEMSQKQRTVFSILYKRLTAVLKPKFGQCKLIGEDYYGTKYYEIEKAHTARKNPPRYFVPVNEDDFEQELPAEWEAWLRYRRTDPPSEEEVKNNYKLQIMKKQNAAKIGAMFSSNKSEESNLSSPKENETFPTYEEYKNDGRNYKIKYNNPK